MLKIAIFGTTGLLGSNLVKNYLSVGFEVTAFSRKDTNKTNEKFEFFKPDIIINAIALVNIQKCEENYDLAYTTNTLIPKQLASIAKQYNAYFIHISTDHYYNDSLPKHAESDTPTPVNNYARTKLLAEQEVLKIAPKSLIVRTNIIGFRHNDTPSFFEWLQDALKNKKNIQLFDNVFTSPISVHQLGKILLECFEKKLSGIYNIASSEVISKFEFGLQTAQIFGYTTRNITQASFENNLPTKKALSLGLDVSKIENMLSLKMPTVHETLTDLYTEYNEE